LPEIYQDRLLLESANILLFNAFNRFRVKRHPREHPHSWGGIGIPEGPLAGRFLPLFFSSCVIGKQKYFINIPLKIW
jgi:hypothetical protein